jgi:hypothetical protein
MGLSQFLVYVKQYIYIYIHILICFILHFFNFFLVFYTQDIYEHTRPVSTSWCRSGNVHIVYIRHLSQCYQHHLNYL